MGPIFFRFQTVLIFVFVLVLQVPKATGQNHEYNSSTLQTPASLDQLLQLAQQKALGAHPQWLRLLHFRQALFLVKSQVTGKNFFLAASGATQPKDEMLATIRGFFASAEQYKDINDHPQCIFPARMKFINQQLGLSAKDWPQVNCPILTRYKNILAAQGVSFAFSSYYTNSPGSAFGHTFFRIHKQKSEGQQSSELLDHGIGYAAQVGDVNAMVYAISGIFGGFRGEFTNTPYYYKVREYNDYEARDIWDYELDITTDEIDYLTLHLWELGNTSFTYYFFTQNCAYHMLSALDASSLRFSFIDKAKPWMLPVDALKLVVHEPGLIKKISYRPSARKVFLKRMDSLAMPERQALIGFIEHRDIDKSLHNLPEAAQVEVLDASLDFVDVAYPEQTVGVQGVGADLKRQLLMKRSELNATSNTVEVLPNPQERPEHGHSSGRFGLFARQQNQQVFGDLEFRFALHEPLDLAEGYPHNSQIEFGRFRFSQSTIHKWYVQQGDFIRAETLNPINSFEKRMSWKMNFGMRSIESNQRVVALGGGQIGFGAAVEPKPQWLLHSMLIASAYSGFAELGWSATAIYNSYQKRLTSALEGIQWWPHQDQAYTQLSAELRFHSKRDLSWVFKGQKTGDDSYTSLGMYLFF